MHTAFHIHSPPAPILCAHACTHMHTLVFTFHTCVPAETQGTTREASPYPGAPQRREPDPGHFPRQQTPWCPGDTAAGDTAIRCLHSLALFKSPGSYTYTPLARPQTCTRP